MIDITDKTHEPTLSEIDAYIGNELFEKLCAHMAAAHRALCSVQYSGDNVLLGWNVRFHKSGKTLCRLYPKKGFFTVLVVIGPKEKERAEAMLPLLSDDMQAVYAKTQEGMGQRWLLFDLKDEGALYGDALSFIALRAAQHVQNKQS